MITKKQKEELIALYNANVSYTELAKRYNYKNAYNVIKLLRRNGIDIKKQNLKKYTCKEDFFTNITSEEQTYWLGVLYADGCIRGNSVCLSSKDYDWQEQFKESLQYNGVIYKEHHKKFDKDIYKTVITSTKLVDNLKNYGCVERKSKLLTFPSLPENLEHHFIRGYFDGDGYVGYRKNRKVNPYYVISSGICSGSKEFLETILSKLPVKHKKIEKSPNKELYSFRFSPKDTLLFYDYMYKDATIYLQRKYQIFQQELQRRSETIIAHLYKTSKEYRSNQTKTWLEKCKQENPEKYEQIKLRKRAYMKEYNKKKKMKE